jgi:hypothetical protein
MATVEEIYQKIRRGETGDLKTIAATDADLVAGVERIRARLSEKSTLTIARKKSITPWVWAPAIAAVVVAAILFWPRTKPQPLTVAQPAGTVWRHGSVEVKILREAMVEQQTAAQKLSLKLKSGTLAVKRDNPATALEIVTPEGRLEAQGTVFVVEHAAVTSLHLLQGKLRWITSGSEKIIDEKNPVLGRSLAAELQELPPHFLSPPPRASNGVNPPTKHTFKAGECVTYYRNNEKRRGKIYAREDTGYIIHGDSGPEPGRFAEGDFFRRSCSE